MKTKYFGIEEKTLNTNEMINDYAFYFQMICEEKDLDFDKVNGSAIEGIS